jgi:gamma-glutamyltranspeptidase
MYHSGIGGGGFMLVRGITGSYEFIDFRETAPAAAYEDMYKNNINASLYGDLPGRVSQPIFLSACLIRVQWRSRRASWFGASP